MDNKIYNEMVTILNASVTDMLGWMAVRGSSVTLNYGEDNEHWECSWITSGKRFTGICKDIPNAIRDAIGQARTYAILNWEQITQ